jgi:hypothetical protein
MDLQLLGCQSSPTSNVLQKDSTMENFIYNLAPSLPLNSRQKIALTAPSSAKFGGTCSFKLPRYGLLNMLLLKIAYTSDLSTGRYKYGYNFGHMLIKKVSLMTNSRAIIELYANENLSRTMELNAASRDSILSMAGSSDAVSTATASAPGTMYIPLLFECFKSSNQFLDLAFMEEVTVSVEFASTDELFSKTTVWESGKSVKIDYDNSQLLAYYVALSDSDLRKYENANFSVDAPLSMLSRSSYSETTQSISGTDGTETSMTVNFNCPNLIEKTILTLRKNSDTTNTKLGDFQTVNKIDYYIGGRIVYSSTGEEELLENALFFNSGLGQYTGPSTSFLQNLYVHYWNLLGSQSDRCSGFVSGKNSSNFSVKVYFTPNETTTYYCDVIHSIAQVISVSGSSGKCSVALSV